MAIFPIISAIAMGLVTISFALPFFFTLRDSGVFTGHGNSNYQFHSDKVQPLYYAVLFLYYIVSYFVATFFNVALIHCANEVLDGRETSIGDGIGMAIKRFFPILGWSVVSATVGVILRAIADNVNWVGQLIVGVFGFAWNVATFFVVPTLAIEGIGPFRAIRESLDTIKKTWGEALIGNIGVSWAITLLALAPVPVFIGLCFTGIWQIIVGMLILMIVWWLALAVIGSCLSGIYMVAVYRYARTGDTPRAFTAEQMQLAFLPKPQKRVRGR